MPKDWDAEIAAFPADAKGMASRVSSGKVLNQVAKRVPWLMGGSADLAPSTNTLLNFDGAGDFQPGSPAGRNFHFGIREHAMGAICNGMALCGLRAYGATFFVFTDYMRPPIRLAAIMGLPVVYHLHARFDRRGRRRPDASAHRATGGVAGDSQLDRLAARRRQRSGRGLQDCDAVEASAGGPGADAAERAHVGPHEVCLGRGDAAGRLRAGRRGRRPARK